VIRVKDERERINVARVYRAGQEHIFKWWEELNDEQRKNLLRQVDQIDFRLLSELARKVTTAKKAVLGDVRPMEVTRLPRTPEEHRYFESLARRGETLLRQGKVAIVTVAGGQGSRMGLSVPKGTLPIGPVTGKPIFQFLAEKVSALRTRYQTLLPWFIMVSEATEEATKEFFRKHQNFGLARGSVRFFRQGSLPALDFRGRLILERKDRIFVSPNGHGGILEAMEREGVIEELQSAGIEYLFYFQVDNPAVKVADPVLIGLCESSKADISSKVIWKQSPYERLGVFVRIDGKPRVIEYSELPAEIAEKRDASGALLFGAGSIAVHVFRVGFLARLIEEGVRLEFHVARKAVPYIDRSGKRIFPTEPNAYKFERFIFDVLEYTDRLVLLETSRKEEFCPVKEREGAASLENARRRLSAIFADWLAACNIGVPRDENGMPKANIEISPLFALDMEELRARIKPGVTVTGDICLEP